jgi:two-component system nitrate/nitrite response regulator NarL
VIPQEILQHLVKQVDASETSKLLQQHEATVDEVIFESVIDGKHYYIVRCRPKSDCHISLSPREMAIAKLVAQGLPNKSIGNQLDISRWTVATHLRRIFGKLGVTSRTAMIARLLEEDLLQE